jgi:hypothetical protein
MQLDVTASNPADFTEVEKGAIEEQVERLLQTPYFSHSRRFPSFLRYVVRHTLEGQADAVKERTLGIEIFGRSADYDTSAVSLAPGSPHSLSKRNRGGGSLRTIFTCRDFRFKPRGFARAKAFLDRRFARASGRLRRRRRCVVVAVVATFCV